jgi:hypothetical protein
METQQQGSTLFSAMLILIALLVVIQLWLVAAAVDAWLAETGVLLPTAVASGVLFALSGGLLWYVVSFDARLRHWSRRG